MGGSLTEVCGQGSLGGRQVEQSKQGGWVGGWVGGFSLLPECVDKGASEGVGLGKVDSGAAAKRH